MEKVKKVVGEFIEKVKTDAKTRNIFIAILVVISIAGYVAVKDGVGGEKEYDLVASATEYGMTITFKADFNKHDRVTEFEMVMGYEVDEDDNIDEMEDELVEQMDSMKEEFREYGINAKVKVNGNKIEYTVNADIDENNIEYIRDTASIYFIDYSYDDIIEELSDSGFVIK